MTVSIVITCKDKSRNLEECIYYCQGLDYPDYEIIVMPDEPLTLKAQGVQIVATGEILPAEKRDIALGYAKGEIIAFLDDDAYPRRDWLKNAVRHFDNPEIAAVCGPAVTPEGDDILQKASGLVYASRLVSARQRQRYIPLKTVFVDDYPSCNFIVRRAAFKEVGGFNTLFWPGEDTILCLKIIKDLKKKILYDPEVLVYHHRRTLFKEHLAQVANYALHRGYFVKRFPENSFKLTYFIPSLFLISLISGAIFSFLPLIKIIYLGILALYLFLVLMFSLNRDIRLITLVFLGIILTHITYGVYFIRGIFSKKLKEE